MNQSQQGRGNAVGAILLIGLGVLFLIGQVIDLGNFFEFGWPLFVVLPGALMLGIALLGDRNAAGFAIPGMIITGTGVILWYQSITNNWDSWAYAWALYPAFVGTGIMIVGVRQNKPNEVRSGRSLMTWGFIAFLIFAAFFETAIFRRMGSVMNWVLPLLLIGVGIFLLLGRGLRFGTPEKPKNDNPPVFTGPRVLNGDYGARPADAELRRKIDEVLAEPDQPEKPKA